MNHAKLMFACAVSALALSSAARAADKELLVFDWAGWEIDGALSQYVEKHGQKPSYSFFGDDDEAFQKVSSGFRADVAHPCASAVPRYRDAGLIEPWDTSKITAFADLDPRMYDNDILKDDAGLWFLPLDTAYAAVAYNTEKVPAEDVATLQVFTDPKYAGRISLPDSNDDVWSLAFLATGVTSWDDVTDAQFTAAADWLRAVHPNVRAYWSDPAEMTQLMASGEVLVSWSWNDGVALLRSENFPVEFNRNTKEGSATFFCGFVNLKDGPGNEDKVYDFVNSLLTAEGAAAIVEELGYAISNTAAMDTLSDDTLKAAYLDPVDSTLFMQSPTSGDFREKMISEFELIKSGF
ncbi:MAG: extracellular solute-binding protein [Paracoccaceae bacterium]